MFYSKQKTVEVMWCNVLIGRFPDGERVRSDFRLVTSHTQEQLN